MKGYLQLNAAEWQAELWARSTKNSHDITDAERRIISKPMNANKVREALIALEGAKAFVKFRSDTIFLPLKDFMRLDHVKATKLDIDGQKYPMPFIQALGMLSEVTLIMVGPPGLGKSTLACTLWATFAKAHDTPYWIETNTPDSLRMVYVNGFFRENVPVLLDEWKPCGGQFTGPDGIDMLKCLCNVGEGSTIKCRYSDIRFSTNMPRIQTCNAADLDAWTRGLGHVTEDDKVAVLRRCVIVEITEHIVPARLRKTFVSERSTACHDLMAQVLLGEGFELPAENPFGFSPAP